MLTKSLRVILSRNKTLKAGDLIQLQSHSNNFIFWLEMPLNFCLHFKLLVKSQLGLSFVFLTGMTYSHYMTHHTIANSAKFDSIFVHVITIKNSAILWRILNLRLIPLNFVECLLFSPAAKKKDIGHIFWPQMCSKKLFFIEYHFKKS